MMIKELPCLRHGSSLFNQQMCDDQETGISLVQADC